MPRQKLPGLPWTDSIRGLACMLVIVWHAYVTITPSDPTVGQERFALPLAVAARSTLVLFVLFSGFLLGRHWVRGFDREGLGARFRTYAVRRTWRIVPPFWAAVTLTIVAMLALNLREPQGSHWDEGLPLTWIKVAANYLMITDFWDQVPLSHPHWTVPLEYHLYFLAPLIVLVRRRWLALTLAVALTLVAAFVLVDYHAPYFPFAFVAAFWAGVARQQSQGTTLRDAWRLTWPIAALSVALLAVMAVAGPGQVAESTRRFFLADCLIGAVFVVWMYWNDISQRTSLLLRILHARAFRWLGERSYSIYLVHAVALECAWRFIVRPLDIAGDTPNFILLVPVAWAVSLAVGVVFFRMIELPSARRSARVGRSPAAPATPAPLQGTTRTETA